VALTITIEGKGVIANADNTGTDTAGGSWGRTGSGGVGWGVTTDTYYYGTSCISMALSGVKNSWIYHDIGSGNELDFGASGTEENQFYYFWVHCPTAGLTDTLANEGISLRVGSSTSDYRTFIIGGSNSTNGWDGGWQCFVIDPTKTGSISDTGTPNLSSMRYAGIQGVTTATAKGDNFFISQIAVGSGLRITGTSTTAWRETVDYCTDLANRAWGMAQEREGIFYLYGNIIIGDTAMTGNCSFDDEARIVQFGLSEYWSGTGTTFNTALPTTACGITLEDDNVATAYTTTFTDGVIVGTDNGRSGSTIIGNTNENVFFDASALANTGSDINLYGTTFKSFAGAITLEADTDHAYLGVSFIDCSKVDPVGAPVIRNCTFAETQDTVAALKWNNNIDIEKCSFIANTTGAGIEHNDWNGSESGTVTTADATGVTLHDSAATFSGNVAVNDIVYNETDGSFATVVTVDSNIQITTDGLSGGTDNQFASSDAYSIATPYSYTDLAFSGNTNDVDNTTSPSNVVAISKAGTSDPSTFPSGDFVVIQGSVTVQVTVKDVGGTAISGAQAAVYLTSDRTEILNSATNGSGVASTTYAGTTPVEVEVRVRKASSADNPRYRNFSSIQNVQSGSGLVLDVTLQEDTNNNATT
jgi:hypothetical protein